jgi:hypothetical protein
MAKKRSGTKASTIAGRVLQFTADAKPRWPVSYTESDDSIRDVCTVEDLRTLAASVLSQDEETGQKPRKRRGR